MKKKVLMCHNFLREGFVSLEDKFELIYPEKNIFKKDEVIKWMPDIDVLVPNFTFKTDAEIINCGKRLQLIANFGVGYNNIDVDYATSKGITVTNTPDSVLEPSAELCFALMLATARRIGFYNTKIHNKEKLSWGLFDNLGLPVYGKTLGIYGMGRIGQAVARRAVASGMKIIYHNRHRLDEKIENLYSARYVDFDTLLRESDFVSLNAPATAETQHLMRKEQFDKMKPTAILINTARGALVDEKALAEALKEKKIFAAGLDVYENEPEIYAPLLGFENVVFTPHAGTNTYDARMDMEKEVAKNIWNFFEGGPVNRVN